MFDSPRLKRCENRRSQGENKPHMGVPLIYLSEYSLPIFSFVFCDELTESQLVHAAVQCLLDKGTFMGDRFIETIAAGEIIGVKPKPGQNPAGDIAA